MLILVNYDLNKPGKDYSNVIPTLENLCSDYIRPLKSFWLLDTNHTARRIREALMEVMDANDRLFICEVTPKNDGWLSTADWEWIHARV